MKFSAILDFFLLHTKNIEIKYLYVLLNFHDHLVRVLV